MLEKVKDITPVTLFYKQECSEPSDEKYREHPHMGTPAEDLPPEVLD